MNLLFGDQKVQGDIMTKDPQWYYCDSEDPECRWQFYGNANDAEKDYKKRGCCRKK